MLSLPKNHPDIVTSFDNIGGVYYDKNENDNALEYYLKSLEILNSSLPSNHPDFAYSYSNIGLIYKKKMKTTKR